jgi:hypothetical protein
MRGHDYFSDDPRAVFQSSRLAVAHAEARGESQAIGPAQEKAPVLPGSATLGETLRTGASGR